MNNPIIIGDCTLYLGDCLEILPTLAAGSVDMTVTSPPYWNLREYSYWETYEGHLHSVDNWIAELSRAIKPGRHICWNIQHFLPDKRNGERYHRPLSADTTKAAYNHDLMLEYRVIWHKPNGHNQRMFGSYPNPPTIIYTPNYEDILIFRKFGQADLSNKTQDSQLTLDEWKEWTLPIWDIAVDYRAMGHPAQYPEELPTRCIRLHSFQGDTILDPFAGSGTTGVACVQTGRKFIGIEIEPKYFDIACKRIEKAQQQIRMDI